MLVLIEQAIRESGLNLTLNQINQSDWVQVVDECTHWITTIGDLRWVVYEEEWIEENWEPCDIYNEFCRRTDSYDCIEVHVDEDMVGDLSDIADVEAFMEAFMEALEEGLELEWGVDVRVKRGWDRSGEPDVPYTVWITAIEEALND